MPRIRTGHVARLPRYLRIAICKCIIEGGPLRTIALSFQKHGYDISEDSLSNWKKGGYQDWLKDQIWVDQMHARQEFALALVRDKEPSAICEATLKIAATQVCEMLKDFDPSTL